MPSLRPSRFQLASPVGMLCVRRPPVVVARGFHGLHFPTATGCVCSWLDFAFPCGRTMVAVLGWTFTDPPLPEIAPPCPILDLFTDGSCLFPTDPDCRVAAYSVIHAAPFSLDYQQQCFRPLVAQPLAGVIQSAFRAELQAVVVALRIVRKFKVWVRIWSDSSSVISLYQKHVNDGVLGITTVSTPTCFMNWLDSHTKSVPRKLPC